MKAALVAIPMLACSAPASTQAPQPEPPKTKPGQDCLRACTHATDLWIPVLEQAHYPGGANVRAQRDSVIAWCSTRCNFDQACVLAARDALALTGCARSDAPSPFMAAVSAVYPLAQYLKAPRKRYRVMLPAGVKLTIEAPEGMSSRLEEGWNLEAPGDVLSPLTFRVRFKFDLGTVAALRELYAPGPGARDLHAEADNAGHAWLTTIDRSATDISSLVFIPNDAQPREGLLCEAHAKTVSGFEDQGEVVRSLEGVCDSLPFEKTSR